MRVVLEVDKGPSAGMRFELTENSYRAVGRAGGAEVTVQLSQAGDVSLDPDDVAVVEAHLAKRKPSAREGGEALRIGGFRRGRDVLLDDDKISRTHAMFFLDEEGASVVDLLSTNGTHVNGKRISDADLHEGDVVNIGKTRFIVHLAETAPAEGG
jgi:pSer/pThr/pTyr-binding forkhead associated (FHA) protein